MQNGEVWYCQSLAKWQEQFPFWNTPKIKRLIRRLEELQVIHSTDKLNYFCVDRTKWQSDYDKLQQLLTDYQQTHGMKEENFLQLTHLVQIKQQRRINKDHKMNSLPSKLMKYSPI